MAAVVVAVGIAIGGQPGGATEEALPPDSQQESSDRPLSTSTLATTPPESTTSSSTTTTTTTLVIDQEATPLPPLPDEDLGRSDGDPVPFGDVVDIGDWRVRVSDSMLDATDFIADYVDFNPRPAAGSQFLLVQLEGTYAGGGMSYPVFEWRLISPSIEIIPDGHVCGIFPESIYDSEPVSNGGSMSGWICFEVPSDEVGRDLLLSLSLADDSSSERLFELFD